MASPLLLALVAWQAVASGNRAYLDLPLDRDYETLVIKATADTKTDAKQVIGNIRVVVNGVAVRELTVDEIRRLNAKYGDALNDQYNSADLTQVVLNFKEDWLWNHIGADALTLFTSGLISVRIEVDILTGLTNPQLGGYAIAKVQRPVAKGKNRIRKTKIDTLDFAGAGTKIFRNISPVGLVKAFDLFSSNNAVTQAKFRISGTEVFNLVKAQVDDAMKQNDQNPAANYFTLPFDLDGTYDAGLVAAMIRETELEVTTSAAANIKLIHQYYEAIA